MIDFDGQVVLVTGAGRGLGRAYATAIADRGGTVAVHDGGVGPDGRGADPRPAREVCADIVRAGGRASSHTQDLARRAACAALIGEVLARHQRLDALVHNAGIVRYHRIVDTPDDEWDLIRAVNIDAAWWLCRAAWPVMVAQGYGRIVLTTSGFGLRVVEGADVAAYAVSKGAQFGLMNALAGDGAAHGIRVNAIAPVAATRIFRRPTQPGELTPESVAPGVALLASRECPVTGAVLSAAGGRWGVQRWQAESPVDLGAAATPEDLAAWLSPRTVAGPRVLLPREQGGQQLVGADAEDVERVARGE